MGGRQLFEAAQKVLGPIYLGVLPRSQCFGTHFVESAPEFKREIVPGR